jgi:hypothetical protein
MEGAVVLATQENHSNHIIKQIIVQTISLDALPVCRDFEDFFEIGIPCLSWQAELQAPAGAM